MAACAKIPYPTLEVAERTLVVVRRRCLARGKRVPTGVHFCGEHRAWHLTSKSKTRIPRWMRRAKDPATRGC